MTQSSQPQILSQSQKHQPHYQNPCEMTTANYIKFKTLSPASKEAIAVGCKCTKDHDRQTIQIDRACPYHAHFATQCYVEDIDRKLDHEIIFSKAVKMGYIILGIFLAAIFLFK